MRKNAIDPFEFWSDFLQWGVKAIKKKYGVFLEANLKQINDITYLYLAYLEVPKGKREKGVGSKVMQSLCAFADGRDYPITMVPQHKDSDLERLYKFYHKFGFVKNTDKRKIPGTLIRKPKK